MLGWEDNYKLRAILQSIWVCKEHYRVSLYDYGCMALLMSLPVFVGIETSASQIALMGSSANEPNNTAVSIFYHVLLFLFQRIPSSHELKLPPLCL